MITPKVKWVNQVVKGDAVSYTLFIAGDKKGRKTKKMGRSDFRIRVKSKK
jgi:hypothetical protein